LTDLLIGRMALVADVAEDDARAEADPGWPAAIAAIAERYGGLRLRPQAGLVPLGPDPRSGLHEFWHPASGARPGRDGEGRLAIESQTGLVFVLVPGGRFWMGSTKRTDGPNHDPHSRVEEQEPFEVALDPYFLSKYEMTQGQWIRLTADNPSSRFAGMRDGGQSWTRTHPVENVDWVTADRELRRFGMKLPTEAQFERAMRGGTATACWWGDDYLDGRELRANCYDDVEPGDGHRLDAPVDSFEPNPFGFYCIAGNLWEWCDDWAVRAFADADVQPGTGRLDAPLATKKTLRGGGFRADVRYLGSARRMPESAQALAADYGLRPARALQR
jgi:formylglycine-generating enzyme required for sulfatase activity